MNLSVPYIEPGNRPKVLLTRKGDPHTYLFLAPARGKTHTVEFTAGATNPNLRKKGWGTRIRALAANATLRAGMTVLQNAVNLEGLVPYNRVPISGRIMHRLGATTMNGEQFLLKRSTRASTRAHARNAKRFKFP
jgi:hypothetical protein